MRSLHRFLLAIGATAPSLFAQTFFESEPNDTLLRADSILCGDQIYGTLAAGGGDLDCYRVILSTDSFLVVDTTSRNGAVQGGGFFDAPNPPSLDDSRLELYDGSGVLIAANDDNVDRPSDQRRYFSRITAQLAAGVYYVMVRGYDGSSEGDYVLYVDCKEPPAAPATCSSFTSGADESEPNDVATDAMVLSTGCCTTHDGSVFPVNDEDVYRLELASAALVILAAETDESTNGATGLPLYDTQLELLASDGVTLIEFNDDSGPGFNALIDRVLAPGTYFVMVDGFTSGTGDYTLRIDCETPVFTPANWYYDLAGCTGSNGVLTTAMPQNGWASLGRVLRIELFNSTGDQALALIGFPLPPLDFAGVGAPGCVVGNSLEAVLPGTVTGPTTQELNIPLPMNENLLGLELAQQWVQLDLLANPWGLTLSDRLRFTVGDF